MLFDGFERLKIATSEIEVNCVKKGDGPPVLLLHGFPQTLSMWAQVAPALATHYTVICADLRGYGDSGKPPCASDCSNYSFRRMALDQIELMQALGFEQFHLIGHDRGGRTGHRMALDHPNVVRSLAVLDIVPTLNMFMDVNREVAGTYWHWYFMQQPAPFPETLIEGNPDLFYETCLAGWGATGLGSFDPAMLAEYRRCWRRKESIAGSCADYRAAANLDILLDLADQDRKVECPTLAFWGSKGTMHRLFDFEKVWSARCARLQCASLPGGHFFVDQFPQETAQVLLDFLATAGSA